MDYSSERIIGVRIDKVSVGGISNGVLAFCVTTESGEEFPLFPFDESAMTFEPGRVIGMGIQEAVEFKRMQDLIHFQQIFI